MHIHPYEGGYESFKLEVLLYLNELISAYVCEKTGNRSHPASAQLHAVTEDRLVSGVAPDYSTVRYVDLD